MATIKSTIQLVDKMSSTLSTIENNIGKMKKALQDVSGEQSSIDNFSWSTFLSNAEAVGEKMESIGRKMTIAMTAPLVMLGKKMYQNSVEYESAFTGVRKTTDATEEQFSQLYTDLLNISETTPTDFVGAAGIMEMAGQLGVGKVNEFGEDISQQYQVATEDLTKFTETYIALQAATNINGEGGAADLARFLNVTEKTTANVDKIGGVIVALGNESATTEQEILSMATRMGATADLAGFSSAEILAFSAALSSVGINAEAGGSAAGKLMKKMQLAAEIGGSATDKLKDVGISWQDKVTKEWHSTPLLDMVSNGMDMVNYLESAGKEGKLAIAEQLGTTTKYVEDLADSWLLFDQFSQVMGISGEEFLSGWDESSAQSMLKFFQGLGNLDPETGNSVLAQLAEMDITEIRLSNLVAAMAGNADLFQKALNTAYQQYGMDYEENALSEEFGKRLDTQEAQNQMLYNKLNNTMADFGDNLVQLLQPALDLANQLLSTFNSLSEVDQTNILKGIGIVAALGPALSIAGKAVELIAKSMKLISGHGKGAADAVKGVADAVGNNGAASAAQTATETASVTTTEAGLSAGSKLAGGLTLAAVGYLFAKGIEYRNQYGALGSIEAIANATNDNEALRNAFLEYVAVNNELETATTDYLNGFVTDEQFEEIAERQQQLGEAFLGIEGANNLLHLYNDWRDTNGLTRMDWLLPEDFLNLFNVPETSTEIPVDVSVVPEISGFTPEEIQALIDLGIDPDLLSGSGADIVNGLTAGINNNAGVAADAASAMGANVIESADSAMGVQSPSVYMISAGWNLDQGLVIGINNGTGMVVTAARTMASRVLAAIQDEMGIHSPSTETYWQGEMMIQGYRNAIEDGSSALNRSVERVIESSETAWNSGVWDLIAGFADTESQALQDEFNHVKNGIKLNESDIRKIRDLAEREVINHFTTAEVRVEMNNQNTIQSDMDIDSLIEKLEDKVTERLEAVAEGVYT